VKGRVRLLWPEFFTDSTISDLPTGTRLFYLGLWTLCDDDGYFPWTPREIGAALFPYEAEPGRIDRIESCLAELQAIERVERLDCSKHGLVPTLPKYRMKGGRPTFPHRLSHESTCTHVRERVVRNERFSESEREDVVRSSGDTARVTLDDAAEAAGGFVAEISKRRNGKSRPVKDEPAQEGRTASPKASRSGEQHT
jgi:hypothetical protein